jgi:hypothetical protein
MNPELKLLITCCKTTPSADDIAFIRSQLTTDNLSLSTSLSHLAHAHGIFPLFYRSLKTHASDLIPGDTLQALKQQYMTIVQRNMLMTAELIRIMKLLQENGIEALAFKGPALAQLAYGDITLRQFVDLDVLIKKDDIYKVDTLLKNRGYQRVLELTPSQEPIWINFAHDLGLYHPDNGVHFEMHWSLMDEDYPLQIDLAEIWKNPGKVTINQQTINTFSNEDLLIYLCIHGSKHLWERIEWIKDIDLLIQSQAIDWNKINNQMEGSGFETMFYLGLYLAGSLFETRFPAQITQYMDKHKKLKELAETLVNSWQKQTSENITSTLYKTHTMLKLFPGIKEQMLYLHKIILKPSFNEYWFVDLPKSLYWVYYFIRPYLLLKKYCTN